MNQSFEIFEDRLRDAFVNRALRINNFNSALKLEIEESIKFRLEFIEEKIEDIAYLSNFAFDIHKSAKHITPQSFDNLPSNSQDVIISILEFQSINDVISYIQKLKTKLREKGALILTFPGNKSFYSLRKHFEIIEGELLGGASPRFFPMIDVKDAGAIIYRCGFKNVISDVDEIDLDLKSFEDFIDFVRSSGLGNCIIKRDKRFLTKRIFDSIEKKISQDADKKSLFQLDLVTVTAYNP